MQLAWLAFFLRFCALRVFFISVWKAPTTACLLLFRISSRWRSINTSVAVAHIRTGIKKVTTTTFCASSIQLSPTHNVRELDRKRVTVMQQEKQQEALLHRRKILSSLFVLMVLQLLHCIDGASAAQKICTRKGKYYIKIWNRTNKSQFRSNHLIKFHFMWVVNHRLILRGSFGVNLK